MYPIRLSYQTSNFNHQVTDNCTTYQTQYTQCSQPTIITDGITEPPFYIWGEAPGQLLFEFPTTVNFSSITIHFQYNAMYAQPKLRFYAVPDTFNVGDDPSGQGYDTRVFDEVGLGVGNDGIRQLPGAGTQRVQFVTTKVLIRKLEDTKEFLFAITEVAFQEFCSQGEFITQSL